MSTIILLNPYCLNSDIIASNLNVNKDMIQALYTYKIKKTLYFAENGQMKF